MPKCPPGLSKAGPGPAMCGGGPRGMSKAGPGPRPPMGGLGERLRSSILLPGLSLLRGRGLLLLCLLLLLSRGLSLSLSLGLLLLLGFSKPAGDMGGSVGVGEWVDEWAAA